MAATLTVAACQSRYSPPKPRLLSSRIVCTSAPARPNGIAHAATSRMTPGRAAVWAPERRYLRLATATATTIPAITHSA
jgi:hypothetical protein